MIFGYIRVSTKEQNIDRQEETIKAYCDENGLVLDRLFVDKASGRDFERNQYKALKLCLRKDDILIIKELDRFGRNMDQIKTEWYDLETIGVNIVIIDMPILNTLEKTDLERKLISNIVFELLSYMAEKERLKIKSRQAEGIAMAKAKGKKLGRPMVGIPENWNEVISDWQKGSITAVRAMELLNMKSATFYRKVKLTIV